MQAVQTWSRIPRPCGLSGWCENRSQKDQGNHRMAHTTQRKGSQELCGTLLLLPQFCPRFRRYGPPSSSDHGTGGLSLERRVWESFQNSTKSPTTPPVLAYPADDGIFILDTDASGQGLRAVLSQLQGGEEHVIAYYSCVLTWPEQQYCVTRRELLAVVEAVKYFHHYLCGRHCVIRTDHS